MSSVEVKLGHSQARTAFFPEPISRLPECPASRNYLQVRVRVMGRARARAGVKWRYSYLAARFRVGVRPSVRASVRVRVWVRVRVRV